MPFRFGHLSIWILDLFRISIFEFRILRFLKPVKVDHVRSGSQGGKSMRAMLLHELGGPVTFHQVDEPRVGHPRQRFGSGLREWD